MQLRKIALLLILGIGPPVWAAGTCTVTNVTSSQNASSRVPDAGTVIITVACTGDASTGSYPSTTIPLTGSSPSGTILNSYNLTGYVLYQVGQKPGGTAPTAGYTVTITDAQSFALDLGLLTGNGSATVSQLTAITSPTVVYPVVRSALTLAITGNSVNSAGITLTLIFRVSGPSGSASGGPYKTFDTFGGLVNTALTAHTDNMGHTWTVYNSVTGDTSTPMILDGNNQAVNTSTTLANLGESLNTLIPPTANYAVQATCTVSTGGGSCVLYGRALTSANTNYIYYCDVSTGCFIAYVVAGGAAVGVGSTVTGVFTSGATHVMQLVMNGTEIAGKIDGAVIISGTDSHVTAIGQGGIRMNGNSKLSSFSIQ